MKLTTYQPLALAFEIRKFSWVWLEILPSTGSSVTYSLRNPGFRPYCIHGIQGKVYDWTVLNFSIVMNQKFCVPNLRCRRMLFGVTWFCHGLASSPVIFLAHLWMGYVICWIRDISVEFWSCSRHFHSLSTLFLPFLSLLSFFSSPSSFFFTPPPQ